MKKTPVFLFLQLVLTSGPVTIAKTPDSTTANFIFAVQSLLFNDQFKEADSLCNVFIHDDSADPVGYLFKTATLLADMSDREEPVYASELRMFVDSVFTLCDKGLENENGSDAAYAYLWRGHAHVYRSLYESRFGSFTSAIKHGFKARDDYQKGLRLDSTLHDFYFGLGNYHYWKSVKAGLLRTLGIVSNETKKGIGELRLAADSGIFFGEAARNSQVWIWLDKKEYDSVIILAGRMLEKYPDSRTLRWPLAEAYFKNNQPGKSAELFTYLYAYFKDNKGNYFNLIECDYQLYQCYKTLNWKEKADEVLSRVNEYRGDIPRATQRQQLAKLNYLRRELGR